MALMYRLGRGLATFCFTAFGRREVVGREAVPPYGPLIVVANHLSYHDAPLLATSLLRPLDFLGKRELFNNPVKRLLMTGFRVHPVDNPILGADVMRLALRLLAQDRALVIFPEGRVSRDHTLGGGMVGAAYLALKSQAPILPVGISGTERVPNWRMALPLRRFRANIGQPFTLPVLEGKPSHEVLASLADLIMYRISALLPQRYRGRYAIAPLPGRAATPDLTPEVGRPAGAGTG